jgi:hypothetical protein
VEDAIRNPLTQVNVRITLEEKQALMELAQRKGCGGITNLLQLLAKARKVDITV